MTTNPCYVYHPHALPRVPLLCSVCANDAGLFEQHWNRMCGFGICRKCVEWRMSRGADGIEMLSEYGTEGVNYAAAPNKEART